MPESKQISILGLWLAYPLAFLFNRFLHNVKFKPRLYLVTNIIVLILGILLVLKIQLYANYSMFDTSWFSALNYHMKQLFYGLEPAFVVILGNCIFFWRGWSLSREQASFSLLSKQFQFSFVMLIFVLFICHLVNISLPNIEIIILIFSSLALIGFGISRSFKNNDVRGIFRDNSSLLLLAAVTIIILLGLLVGSFITPDLFHIILTLLKWIGNKIVSLVIFLVNLFPQDTASSIAPPGEALTPSPREEIIDVWTVFNLPSHYRIIGQRIFVSLFMLGLLITIYRIFVDIWHWMRRYETGSVTIESIRGNLFSELYNSFLRLFRYIVNIILSRWQSIGQRKITEKPTAINSVRQVYRNLLHWGAAGGIPHQIHETPYEYLEIMRDALPVNEYSLLSQITDAYIDARYGNKSEDSKFLHEIKECWNVLRKYKLKIINKEERISPTGSIIIGGKK